MRRIPAATLHTLAFLLVFLLLAALAWQAKRMQETLLHANRSVSHSLEVITVLKAILSSLQDVETGERGFVITGQPIYLDPYLKALERLAGERRRLDELLAPLDAASAERLARLDQRIAERLQIAAGNIESRRQTDLPRAAAQLAVAGGRQTMDQLRGLLGELEAHERRRLAREHGELERHLARGHWQAQFGGLLLAVLFFAALLAISRSLRIRQRLASQAQAGEARLRALLQAIPDRLYEMAPERPPRQLTRRAAGAADAPLEAVLQAAAREAQADLMHSLHWQDAEQREFEIRVVPAGAGVHLAIVREVTETLRARRRLRDQQVFLRSVVDADENLIFVRDAEGRFLLCNQAFAQLLDLRPAQVEGRLPRDLADAGRLDGLLAGDDALLGGAPELRRDELLVEDTGGRERWLQLLKRPLHLSDGSRQILAVAVDISVRRQIERLKAEFISTVSHELRTPLTAIRSALGMLSGSLLEQMPADLRPLLAIAQRNSERLVRLINDILDMEKLEAGGLEFHWTVGPLQPLLSQALENTEPYARDYGVHLALEVLEDAPVRLDTDRFAQIMANLLSNAIKHSPPGSEVRVTLARHGEQLEVAVSDRGSGIPLAFQPRVFERFAQADASDARRRGGTGLGLAITRSLVQHLGGAIGFASQPGHGSRFFVRLPLAAPAPPSPRQARRRPLILVLEAEPAAAASLAELLEAHGYATLVAHSAAQARERLAQNAVQALTLSPQLPDEDALAFLAGLRQQPALAHLPVLVVSLQAPGGEPGERLAGNALGLVDWLDAPLDQQRLLSAVHSGLGQGQPLRILHVEDDPDLRRLVARLLQGSAVELHGAGSLAEARAALTRRRHGLVILDLGLPDGDGGELLPELAAARPPTPVVIFSARDPQRADSELVLRQLVKSRHDSEDLAALIRDYLKHWPASHNRPAKEPR